MEKYAVQIDKDKVEKEKLAGAGKSPVDPNRNVPMDPERGTEPYEKRPDAKSKSDQSQDKKEG